MALVMQTTKSYWRADLLSPADIVLSTRKKPSAKAIRAATEGPYSHAELVVAPTRRFDATLGGLGYEAANIIKCEVQPNGDRYLIEDITRYRRVDVFRHPAIEAADPRTRKSIESKIRDITVKLNGYQYSQLRRVVAAAPRLRGYPKIKKWLERLLDRYDRIRVNPGPFCSELIAVTYSELGIKLFKAPLAPSEVSPSTLADPAVSFLQQVGGLLCAPDPTNPDHEELMDMIATSNRVLCRRRHDVKLKTDTTIEMARAAAVNNALDKVIALISVLNTRFKP